MPAGKDLFQNLLASMDFAHGRDEIVDACFTTIDRPTKDDELETALDAARTAHEQVARSCTTLSNALDGSPTEEWTPLMFYRHCSPQPPGITSKGRT